MKKYLTGCIAIILAIGLNSFTAQEKETKLLPDVKWYFFFGNNTIPAELHDTAYYRLDEVTGLSPSCSSPCYLFRCSILVAPMPGYPNKPDLIGGTVFYETTRAMP